MKELRIEANGNLGPIDSSRIPRYAGAATFARLPRLDQVAKADVTLVGVPFDSGVSYRPGARFGPAHVRESSRLLRPYNPAVDVEPFAAQQVVDAGDIAANPFDIGTAIGQIEAGARGLAGIGCPGRYLPLRKPRASAKYAAAPRPSRRQSSSSSPSYPARSTRL